MEWTRGSLQRTATTPAFGKSLSISTPVLINRRVLLRLAKTRSTSMSVTYKQDCAAQPKAQRTRGRPTAPAIRIDQPGRLRVGNLLALFGVCHATFYARLKQGLYPKPDGYDGRLPFWKTATVKAFLDA